MPDLKENLLRDLPSVSDLLKTETALGWLRDYPQPLVSDCLRRALAELRQHLLQAKSDDAPPVDGDVGLLSRAGTFLRHSIEPRVRQAINATGIILHTGLGRAVIPEGVIDSIDGELKGYCTLAVDRESGDRVERDELVEHLLTELTGAEAGTVVNNNASATLLVLAALAAPGEVIVSRGQLIEIGGSFRLPEVMAQSGARLVEVGATNRTHLKDYQKAITENTSALLRVHPSNYRIIGFTSDVPLRALAELSRSRKLLLLDDLGAGALVDLKSFGLPHEPTVRESVAAGADIVFSSGDKLIGAGQSGIIVGKKSLVDKLRRHPLMRAVRVNKTCLMMLERTLPLFRDPARLAREHPVYRMLSTPPDALKLRAAKLTELLRHQAPGVSADILPDESFLGSGSLPTEPLESFAVSISVTGLNAGELGRRLRLDDACIFGRIADDRVRLNVRTLADEDLPRIAAAMRRISARP